MIFVPVSIIIFNIPLFASGLRTWDYTFLSLDIDNKCPDWIIDDINIVKIKKGDYALNGTFILKKSPGLDFMYTMDVYRSPRGNDDYKPTPFAMPKQSLGSYLNGVYKDVVMEDLHKCSNLPYFQGKFEGEVEAKEYFINMCKFNVENWPDYLPAGFYKFVVNFFDESENLVVKATLIEQIEQTGIMG